MSCYDRLAFAAKDLPNSGDKTALPIRFKSDLRFVQHDQR